MATLKDKVADAGQSVAHAAKKVGHKIADGATQAADYVKEHTGLGAENEFGIREKMDVIASCGTKIGVVDHVNDGAIKLTRKDSPDGEHHFIPTAWVESVGTAVHLNRNSMVAKNEWKADAASCNCA